MKVSVRPLNSGETFCCSIRSAKQLFQNTKIHLNFGFYGRDYSVLSESALGYYLKNKIKGRVVASLTVYNDKEDTLLSFYVLNERDFSSDLKQQFETIYLPKMLNCYKLQLEKQDIISTARIIIIEFSEGRFIVHEKDI